MKRFETNLSDNPVFNTVNGLSNRTFDPGNIVSGRGATEDQLKVVGDKIKEIDDYITESGCCENDPYQEMINQLRNRIDALETQINGCCQDCFDGGGASTDCDGSTVTVTMSWDDNPVANGGQMTASSSGGANIVFYYFLIKSTAGVYVPVGTVGFVGQGYSVNGSTGKLSFDPNGLHGSVSGIAIGARDANGCEGIGMFVPVLGVNPIGG